MFKNFLLFTLSIFLVGCSLKGEMIINDDKIIDIKTDTPKNHLKIIEKPAKIGYDINESRYIDTIVIHTANNVEFEGDPYGINEVIRVFEKYKVSPHYIIGRDGAIYRTVDEKLVARHAGKSQMQDGREGANLFSIGVELINSKADLPTQEQYDALAALINDIKSRYAIKYVVGHKDIAPLRKTDPWNFDFEKLNKLLSLNTDSKQSSVLAAKDKSLATH